MANVFAAAADSADPAEKMDDESLGAVQAVNFITAAKEAAQRAAGESRAPSRLNGTAKPEAAVAAHESIADPIAEGPIDPVPPAPGCTVAFMDSGLRIVGLPPDRPNLPPMFALHGSAGLMKRGNWDAILAEALKHAGDDLGVFVLQQPKAQSWEPSRADQMPSAAGPPKVLHRRPR